MFIFCGANWTVNLKKNISAYNIWIFNAGAGGSSLFILDDSNLYNCTNEVGS